MIARVLLFALSLLAATPAAAKVDWTDLWYDPAEPGWGVNLVQSDTFMYATFFIYGANGAPTWYTAHMTWRDSTLSFFGNLYATTGTGFAYPWAPGNHTATVVGSAYFSPTQGSEAVSYKGTLGYVLFGTGVTVVKPIERQPLTRIDLTGVFAGSEYGEDYGCTAPSSNGTYTEPFDLTVTQPSADRIMLSFQYQGGLSCTLSGSLEQHGGLHRVYPARYSCSNGLDTVAMVYDLKAGSLGIEGRFYAASVGGGCSEAGKFASVYAVGAGAQ
jgi:hypothetical protein